MTYQEYRKQHQEEYEALRDAIYAAIMSYSKEERCKIGFLSAMAKSGK